MLTFEGDALTISASTPIDGLDATAHRKPVLAVEGARYVLVGVRTVGQHLLYELAREREDASIYVIPGPTIEYVDDRHLVRRRAQTRAAAAWIVYLALLPAMPFLGLLPHGAKMKLEELGISRSTSTGVSLLVEWALAWPAAAVFWLSIASGSFPFMGAAFSFSMIITADLCWRWSGLQEDPPRYRGMFSVVGAVASVISRALRRSSKPDPR